MQNDQKIGLSLLIAIAGFALALGFGRRESPVAVTVEQAELAAVDEALAPLNAVDPPRAQPPSVGSVSETPPGPTVVRTPATASDASTRPTLPPPGETASTGRVDSVAVGVERSLEEAPAGDDSGPAAEAAPSTRPPSARPPSARPPAVRPPAVRPYVVRPGDTLSGIAARTLGDANRYADIYDANRQRLRHPDDLRIGQTLAIPVR